jgi:hypothetical protein
VARAQAAWRCSQCGTVNEAGARSCANCGKWPSLFDLQETVEDVPVEGQEALETFEPELFEPETFEPETYEPQPYETGLPEQDTFEPEAEDAEQSERSRFPRWAITAIWVVGLIIWFLANALGDR